MAEPAEKAEKAESLNAPFFKLWSMLRPNLRSIFRDEWELLPFAAVCLARGWEVRWSTELVRSLDKSLVHRNPKLFWGLGEPFPQGMMWGVVVGLCVQARRCDASLRLHGSPLRTDMARGSA